MSFQPHYQPPPVYRPGPPPHHPPPSPPPPPPPPPEVVLDEEQPPGTPRCYFCGSPMRHEADVKKTKYAIGNGYKIFVFICPSCTRLKEQETGPFEKPVSGCLAATLSIILLIPVAFGLVGWLISR